MPGDAVRRRGAGRRHRLGRLVVGRPDDPLRDPPGAGHGLRRHRRQPAGVRARAPRGRPLLPLGHLPVPPDPVREPGVLVLGVGDLGPALARRPRSRADHGRRQRRRHQHRPRAGPQARGRRALAVEDRARELGVRALLRRAQPRPPRPRRDPGGPGELAARRGLLDVPAAHGLGQPALVVAPGVQAPVQGRPHALRPRDPRRLGDDRRAVRRARRRVRAGRSCPG